MIVPFAARACLDVEFECNCSVHCGVHGLDRLLCDKSPAEIGVQHRSGQVEHRAQGGALPSLELRKCVGGEIVGFRHGNPGAACGPRMGERTADGLCRGVPTEALYRHCGVRCLQYLIYRWKIA